MPYVFVKISQLKTVICDSKSSFRGCPWNSDDLWEFYQEIDCIVLIYGEPGPFPLEIFHSVIQCEISEELSVWAGSFFRDQIFSVPVPVPSKKEQHSRDRDVTLWQRGKKKICFSLKSCISHGWLLFHSLFHFGNSFLLIPFYSFTFSPFSRCQILPLCSTFPPFSFSPFLKI